MRKPDEARSMRSVLQDEAPRQVDSELQAEVVNDPRNKLTLRMPRRIIARRLASAMVFLLLIFFLASTTSGIRMIVLTLCGLAVSVWHVAGARATLTLTPMGFTFHGLRSHTVRWRDVEWFGVTYVPTRTGTTKRTSYHFTPARIAERPRRSLLRNAEGGTLPVFNDLTAVEQAALMETWHQRWVYGIEIRSPEQLARKMAAALHALHTDGRPTERVSEEAPAKGAPPSAPASRSRLGLP